MSLRKKQALGDHIEGFLRGLSRFIALFDIVDERFAILLMLTDRAGDNRPPPFATTGAEQYRNGKLNCPAKRSTRFKCRPGKPAGQQRLLPADPRRAQLQ